MKMAAASWLLNVSSAVSITHPRGLYGIVNNKCSSNQIEASSNFGQSHESCTCNLKFHHFKKKGP